MKKNHKEHDKEHEEQEEMMMISSHEWEGDSRAAVLK